MFRAILAPVKRWIACLALAGCGGGHAGPKSDATSSDATMDALPPPAPTCTVPVMPVDTSAPDHVVGDGTAGSCTEQALATAVAAGGTITFYVRQRAGDDPDHADARSARTDVDHDASTAAARSRSTAAARCRSCRSTHPNYRVNDTTLTLQHIAFAHGHAHGTMMYATAPAPCSQGYYDGYGGALYVRDGELVVIDASSRATPPSRSAPTSAAARSR